VPLQTPRFQAQAHDHSTTRGAATSRRTPRTRRVAAHQVAHSRGFDLLALMWT